MSPGGWAPVDGESPDDAELESPEPDEATSLGAVEGVDESVAVDEPGDGVVTVAVSVGVVGDDPDDDEVFVFDPDVDEVDSVEPDDVEEPDEVLDPVEVDEDPVADSVGCDDVDSDGAVLLSDVEGEDGDDVEGESVVWDGAFVEGEPDAPAPDCDLGEVDFVGVASSLHQLIGRFLR